MGRLFSAKVENRARQMITVEATYVPINGNETTVLVQAIQPGHSHTFGPRKTEKGSQMYIDKFSVTDGENRDNTFAGPFVEQDKDKKVIVISEAENGNDFEILVQ